MSQKISKAITCFSIIAVVIGAVFLANGLILAWSPPTQSPTGGNVPAPLNVGSDTQSKAGGLNIGGNVGIGTTGLGYKLEVAGDIRTLSGGDLRLGPAVSGNDAILYSDHGELSFYTDGATRMTLSANGDLNVSGTITANDPSSNLNVGGDIEANSISGGAWQQIIDKIQDFDTCKDTDGGLAYTVKGTVTKGTETHTDYCRWEMYGLDHIIGEYYCSSGACALTEQWCDGLYGQEYSCSDGACVKTCDNATCRAQSVPCDGDWETNCCCDRGYCYCTDEYCGGGPCFAAGTKVTMSNGLLKNIEDVVKGEKVLGRNGAINTFLGHQSHPIRKNGRIYSINNKIEVTPDHPFLAKDGKWKVIDLALYQSYPSDFKVEADELKIGDILITQSGEEKVNSIELVKGKNPEDMVYDLIVDGDHTYTAGGFIVHTE